MTNDPYRDGPGGPPPPEGAGPIPPEAAWMPPTDPTQPGPPPPGPPPFGAPSAPAPQPADQTEPGQPTYQPPQYQPYQYQALPGQPAAPPPGGPRPTNGLAIAALVCSLAGFVTIISAPVGAVLGHLATRQIAQTGEEGASLAKAAIWVGWIITGIVLALCCAGLAIGIAASRTAHAFGGG